MGSPPLPATLRFVLLTLVVNAIGFGVIVSLTPQLVMKLRSVGLHQATIIGGGLAVADAFALHGCIVFSIGMVMAMQCLVHPSLTSMMNRKSTPETQGEMQGFSSSAMAFGAILAPLLFNPTQIWFTSTSAPFQFAGAALLFSGLLAVLAAFLLWKQSEL